jgi:hypothetical protein
MQDRISETIMADLLRRSSKLEIFAFILAGLAFLAPRAADAALFVNV